MNSFSLSFVLLVVIAASFGSEEIEVHDEISFHHKLQNYEAELETVTFSFSSNETLNKRESQCVDALKEGPKGVAACMKKLSKQISTKDKLTLSCFPITQLFSTPPASFKLEAFECTSFDRTTGRSCNRQLLKKYRDYFITENKVCITRNTNQVCLGKPNDAKCLRFYDFSVAFQPNKCNEQTATILVANNQASLKEFGGSCKLSYAPKPTTCELPQIDYCTMTGCFLKKPLKGEVEIEIRGVDNLRSEFVSCFSISYSAGMKRISLYTGDKDLMEGCIQPNVEFRITHTCGGGLTPTSIIKVVDPTPVVNGGDCMSSSDCDSYNCEINSYIGDSNAPKNPSVCGTAKTPCPALDVDFCTPSGCHLDTAIDNNVVIASTPISGTGDCGLKTFNSGTYIFYNENSHPFCDKTPKKVISKCAKDRKPSELLIPSALLANGVNCLVSSDCTGTSCDGAQYDGNGFVTQYGSCIDESACFTGETRITMSDGSKKIMNNIKIGDKVKGYNGEEGVVIHKVAESLGSDYIVSINDGEFFFSPDHPFMLPGAEISQKQSYRSFARTGASEKMDVGSFIYKWNDAQGKMETVEITSIKTSKRSTDTEVYALTVWSPSYSGSYIGEGYISSVGPNLVGLLVKYGLSARVYNIVQSKYENAYNNYVSKGNTISKFDFCVKLSEQLDSQIDTIFKAQYPTRIKPSSKYVASWKSEFESDWQNNFNEEVGNFLQIFTETSYSFRMISLYSLNPTAVLPYFTTTFAQEIGNLLDNVVVV